MKTEVKVEDLEEGKKIILNDRVFLVRSAEEVSVSRMTRTFLASERLSKKDRVDLKLLPMKQDGTFITSTYDRRVDKGTKVTMV